MIRTLLPLLLALLVASPAAAGPRVLAAASLQEAMTAAADAWARAGHPRPRLSFAASSALARQVAAGAPADLFVSADEAWMDDLQRRGRIRAGTRATLAGNRLVVVAPAATARPVRLGGGAFARALGDRRLALADPAAVPAGRYARAALERLGEWPGVAPRVVRAASVRAALALVERGVAPYGIVYATDARVSPRVRVVATIPAAAHPSIRYPLAIVTQRAHPDSAAFRAWLLSAPARAILVRHGFIAP